YGTYRRLLQDCESIAWLRLELSAEGRLNADLKAHSDDRAGINASLGEMADNLDATRAGKLLLNCLRPLRSSLARQQGRAHASGSERRGQDVDGVIGSALKATNGALLQAGAQIVPLAPAAWEAAPRQRRMTLRVEVNGNDVAHMHIERLGHAMEVAVGVHDASLVALGRRRSLPVEGMTVHALAELIAGCAWPAIARFKQVRGSA